MDLSIVIPAYEESKKIGADVEAAAMFLGTNHLTGEIIVVDDGSKDGTGEVAKNTQIPPGIHLKVVRLLHNRGKGYAIRTGIKQSTGEYVMFADSGGCVPYGNVLQGLNMLKNGDCDIAHGSRKLRESNIEKPQNWHRRIYSRIFRWLMIYAMKIPSDFTDTQCGFKIYRGDVARKLYGQCITDGFMFDVEIVMRAQKAGYRIKEFPVDWTCDCDSRISLIHTSRRVLLELITIKRTLANL